MKRLLLASVAAAIISGAAQAQPTPAADNGFGQAYRGTHHPDRKLTRQFPDGSFPPGYRPTPLQETLARNGAAAVDAQHYNSWRKRNN